MTGQGATAANLQAAPELQAAIFQGVAAKFLEAVNAFNRIGLTEAQAIAAIGPLLDDNVKLYHINNGAPVSGRREVVLFLTAVLGQHPILAPVTSSLHPPSLPTSVRGTALWRRNQASPTLSIRYAFDFQPDPPHLITSLWRALTDFVTTEFPTKSKFQPANSLHLVRHKNVIADPSMQCHASGGKSVRWRVLADSVEST